MAMRELRAMVRGRVVSRGDDDYSRTRQVWNRAVEDRPALFAVCETSADVQAACGVHVNTGCPYRCAAVHMTGWDAPYVLMDSSLTSAR